MPTSQNKGLLFFLGLSLVLTAALTAENVRTAFSPSADTAAFSQEAPATTTSVDIIKLKETLQRAGLTPRPAKFWKKDIPE